MMGKNFLSTELLDLFLAHLSEVALTQSRYQYITGSAREGSY